MRIAVCFITCERYEYSVQTMESFIKHNHPKDFICLHADDCSEDKRVFPLAMRSGFESLNNLEYRLGCHANQRRAVRSAKNLGATHVLLLQNDWRWVRPFPWELCKYAFSVQHVYNLRLFGEFKEDGKRPCGKDHYGKNKRLVDWVELEGAPEDAEIGDIHWTHTPSVTEINTALWLMENSKRENEAMKLSGELDLLTVRPVNNVVNHFGAIRTPGFKH